MSPIAFRGFLWGRPTLPFWPNLPRRMIGQGHTTVETFANAAAPTTPPPPPVVAVTLPRNKRSVTLKTSRKEKKSRRPGEEVEGLQRIRVMSCNEVGWQQLRDLFPTATHVDQQVAYITHKTDPERCSFLFPYGVCVFWAPDPEEMKATVALMNDHGTPAPRIRKVDFGSIRDDDFFYFSHTPPALPAPGEEAPAPSPPFFARDGHRFTLHDTGVRLKLVMSHAFAHSVRLDILEQQFRGISFATKDIAPKQRDTGRIPVDWEEVDIVSTIGALDAIRRELEIDGCIGTIHDLFWDEDELSEVLDSIREYLEIEERADHLLAQIALVRSQLADLQTEIHAKHNHTEHSRAIRREWYIILLIFYEAVVVKIYDWGEHIASFLWS